MTAARQVGVRPSKQTTYETSQTSTRRVGMCQVGASRKFVSEAAVAILRHRVFAIHVLLAAFRHRAENWRVSRGVTRPGVSGDCAGAEL